MAKVVSLSDARMALAKSGSAHREGDPMAPAQGRNVLLPVQLTFAGIGAGFILCAWAMSAYALACFAAAGWAGRGR